jgi:hypothetical protein
VPVPVPVSISVKIRTLRGSFLGSAHDERNSACPGRVGVLVQRATNATRPVPLGSGCWFSARRTQLDLSLLGRAESRSWVAENCRQRVGGGGRRIRMVRWIGRYLSGSESNQSPPSEEVASAVTKNAQLSTRGAETAAGSGCGGVGAGSSEQQGPEQGQHENGPHRGDRASVRARAIISRSIDFAVVRDVTSVPRAAMADDGASTPHAKQASSP